MVEHHAHHHHGKNRKDKVYALLLAILIGIIIWLWLHRRRNQENLTGGGLSLGPISFGGINTGGLTIPGDSWKGRYNSEGSCGCAGLEVTTGPQAQAIVPVVSVFAQSDQSALIFNYPVETPPKPKSGADFT